MSNPSTLIQQEDAARLVQSIGQLIRDFLTFINDPGSNGIFSHGDNKKGAMQSIEPPIREQARLFANEPALFQDQNLTDYGADFEQAVAHPVRIEVRQVAGEPGVAQIAARGIHGRFREAAVSCLKAQAGLSPDRYYIRLSGNASFEINIAGVNKALPLRYLTVKWDDVLNLCSYRSGPTIDARRSRTLVAADGDGTTWESPKDGIAPALDASPVHDALLSYLRHGGIYLIISGNHLERTIHRVQRHIPADIRRNLLVSANGGANLVYFDQAGDMRELEDYGVNALSVTGQADPASSLDVIYLGDDGRQSGNDREAFEAVGAERSILVANQSPTDIIPFLSDNTIGGLVHGTRRVLEFINGHVQDHPHNEIFTRANVATIVRYAAQA